MFLDEAIIEVSGGSGGRGCVSWRREKYVAKGGPDGGDGGHGGEVYFRADSNTDTLSDFASRKSFAAQKGHYGSGKNKTGKNGDDLFLKVPPGTIVTDLETNQIVADLMQDGDQFLIARGGRGGFGNAHFKSSTRQRPDFAELGEPGQKKKVKLELKLVADVGIIGFPSVGKSTLISVVSAAKPKIADYPFTTLIPNLGVVTVDDREFVICDLPGLIEGASEGKGLGDAFLKHVERCGIFLHLLDLQRALKEGGEIDYEILLEDYRSIRSELEAYSPALSSKQEVVVLNKVDLTTVDALEIIEQAKKAGVELFTCISAATHQGIDPLLKKLLTIVLNEREKVAEIEVEDELPVLKPHEEVDRMGAYRIEKRVEDDSVVIHGKRLEQLARMTDVSSEGAIMRFRDVLERIGVSKALKRMEVAEGTRVYIGSVRVDEYL